MINKNRRRIVFYSIFCKFWRSDSTVSHNKGPSADSTYQFPIRYPRKKIKIPVENIN